MHAFSNARIPWIAHGRLLAVLLQAGMAKRSQEDRSREQQGGGGGGGGGDDDDDDEASRRTG